MNKISKYTMWCNSLTEFILLVYEISSLAANKLSLVLILTYFLVNHNLLGACVNKLSIIFNLFSSSNYIVKTRFIFRKNFTFNLFANWRLEMIVLFLFYILIMDEKALVLCEKWLSKFSSNLYVLRPHESEKRVFTKVCPSVCLSVCRSCAA